MYLLHIFFFVLVLILAKDYNIIEADVKVASLLTAYSTNSQHFTIMAIEGPHK